MLTRENPGDCHTTRADLMRSDRARTNCAPLDGQVAQVRGLEATAAVVCAHSESGAESDLPLRQAAGPLPSLALFTGVGACLEK